MSQVAIHRYGHGYFREPKYGVGRELLIMVEEIQKKKEAERRKLGVKKPVVASEKVVNDGVSELA